MYDFSNFHSFETSHVHAVDSALQAFGRKALNLSRILMHNFFLVWSLQNESITPRLGDI